MKKSTLLSVFAVLLFSCADYDSYDEDNPSESRLSVTDVHDTTVVLRWTKCTDENFLNYKVYFDSTDIVDYNDKLLDSLSFAQDTVKIVRNLKHSTVYYFRVIVTNLSGKMTPSNTASAITWLSLSSRQICDSSVILKWTPIGDYSISGYSIFGDTSANVDTLDTRVSTDTVLTIKDLAVGTTMRYRAYAMGSSGYVDSSDIVSVNGWYFKLFSPDSISSSMVKLHWARVKDAVNYRIFRDVKYPVDTIGTLCATATDTVKAVENLTVNTTYWFKVYAQKNDGSVIAWTMPDSIRLH